MLTIDVPGPDSSLITLLLITKIFKGPVENPVKPLNALDFLQVTHSEAEINLWVMPD